MSVLKFAKNGNYKRFYDNLKVIGKEEHKNPVLMFIDCGISMIFTGSGLSDYLNYKFYKKTFKERRTYATIGYQAKFYKIAGLDPDKVLNNKINFLKNYPELTKRDFFSYDCGIDKLKEFLKKHDKFIMKPINGLGGTDVKKMSSSEIKDINKFYNSLKEKNMFLEELIIQDEKWGKISPKSINTIRVMTSNVNGNVEIFCMIARIGNSINIQDNFHQGGVGVFIDTENEVLKGNAINKDMQEFITHPVSNIKFDGYKIPYFKEIVKLTKEAASKFDKTIVIGWDVAITKNGPLIIEGNNGPGFDLPQVVLNKGTKYMLLNIKKQMNQKK